MESTIINSAFYTANAQKATQPNQLGKDEFIKILMTQLQNQDPLNPMEDREFIAQMTAFSSLEQMINMANSIDKLVNNQQVSPVVQYSHFIGKNVTYEYENSETGLTDVITSRVIAVSERDTHAVLELENNESVLADHIIRIGGNSNGAMVHEG